jgi:ATP-binding cassette, subfamily B, multidrug efflux pump
VNDTNPGGTDAADPGRVPLAGRRAGRDKRVAPHRPKSPGDAQRPDQSADFTATARRTTALLTGRRGRFAGVLALGALSVGLTVTGPVLLGHATDLVVGGTLDGTDRGIDFAAVARVLLYAVAVYLAAGLCGVLQARLATVVVQHAAERLRRDVEAKLARIPLGYFDRKRRGEIISRCSRSSASSFSPCSPSSACSR